MSPSRTKNKQAFYISFGGEAIAMEEGFFFLRQERRRTKE